MNLDLGYAIEQEYLADEDLLIVAGDNLFEFRLADFVDFYRLHQRPIVAFCDLKDVGEDSHYACGLEGGCRRM